MTSRSSSEELSPRRAKIFSRIVDEYRRKGFLNLTIDELAASIGSSKSTIYGFAPTRKQLDERVLRAHFAEVQDRIDEVLAHEDDPFQRLRLYLDTIGHEARKVSPEFIKDIGLSSSQAIGAHWLIDIPVRIRALVSACTTDSSPEMRSRIVFLSEAIVAVFNDIEYGRFRENTSLSHADTYSKLADLAAFGASAWLRDSAIP